MSADGAGIVIRPMRPHDVAVVRGIDELVFPEAWSPETWLAELGDRSDRHHVVAESDGRVVAHGGLMLVLADAHITTVAVDPAWRRRGVARRLVVALLVAARFAAATAATLEVRSTNDAAIALYRAFGFVPVGTRRDYYSAPGGGREDALVMWLSDLDGVDVGRRLASQGAAVREPAR